MTRGLRASITLSIVLVLSIPPAACASSDCAFRPTSPPITRSVAKSFGVNIEFTDPQPGEIKMMAEAGFRWVRIDLKWDLTEAEKGRYEFASYDRLLKSLEPFGIRVLFILDYGNPLYDQGAPPRTEETRQAFARWSVAAAKHFAGRGAIWEIYNEPNIAQFWPPKPDVDDYVALALTVAKAFRNMVPGEQLVGPATAGIDFDFLEACFRGGLLNYWSAVTVHPYRRDHPETAAQDYCRLRELIRKYASAGKEIPIISGEWGYSSVWPKLDEDAQGRLLARQWLTNVGNEIPLSIWYDWRDDGLQPSEPEHHFGTVYRTYHPLRSPVYDPKPAYLAARTFIGFFGEFGYAGRLETGRADEYLLWFRKGGEVRFAVWTTSEIPRKASLALPRGEYRMVRHTGEDVGKVVAGARLEITLTTAPLYLRRE